MSADIVARLARHAHINDKPLKARQAMLDAADEIERLRAERDEARAESERTHALLKDPNAVAINMLRGVIALPSADQIRHIYQQAPEAKP